MPPPYGRDNVFAGVGAGLVKRYDAHGRQLGVLDTRSGSTEEKGMCFDPSGNLYVTNFDDGTMSKFDNRGRLVAYRWGGRFGKEPESCVADAAGHIYVGEVHGTNYIRKFDAAGRLLKTFKPRKEYEGTDWMDLARDQCTIYYTSEGGSIKRFNVCSNRQLPDFVHGLAAPCYALRIRPNGEVLVACISRVYHLDGHGRVMRTYTTRSVGEKSTFFAMNLDPDNTSFWTAGFESGHIYRINIATGKRLTTFVAPPYQLLGGVAVSGEIVAAQPNCSARGTVLPLSVHTVPATPFRTGRPTVGVQTTAHAKVVVTMQVTTSRTVTTGQGTHRRKVTRTVVLYQSVGQGIADAHGHFTAHLRYSYRPVRRETGRIVVTARLACATASRTALYSVRP